MSDTVVSLAAWREGKGRKGAQRRQAHRCGLCGQPGGYGASLLVCGPCRAVEALCGHDLGLAAEVLDVAPHDQDVGPARP